MYLLKPQSLSLSLSWSLSGLLKEISLYPVLFLYRRELFSIWTEHICPQVTSWLPIIRLHLQAQSRSCFVAATIEMWQSYINNHGSWEASLNIFLGSSHGLHANGALGSIINLACWPFQILCSARTIYPRLWEMWTTIRGFLLFVSFQIISFKAYSSLSCRLIGIISISSCRTCQQTTFVVKV